MGTNATESKERSLYGQGKSQNGVRKWQHMESNLTSEGLQRVRKRDEVNIFPRVEIRVYVRRTSREKQRSIIRRNSTLFRSKKVDSARRN